MTFEEYLSQTKRFLLDLFSLEEDRANEMETVMMIRKGVEFKGINVWILIFAIFVASIGLNVNSAAVVIGAMLISPLMGPIMGVGLSLGIYDFGLFTKSLKNLSIMVVLSILSSAIYFAISPLHEAQSELIARTSPTIWDVFIALFGGLAGIVAGSSREKGNVVPGVAIATALMPPLCTAGYGIANSSMKFFIGGFYLFVINTIFIALTTYFVVRLLKFKKKEFIDAAREKRVTFMVPLIALLTIIPSVFLAINLVRANVESNNLNRFLKTEINATKNQIISRATKTSLSTGPDTLIIFLLGESLNGEDISILNSKLNKYQPNYVLQVKQDLIPQEKVDLNVLRSDVMKDLYKNNEEIIKEKNATIRQLETKLADYIKKSIDIEQVVKEAKAIEPNLTEMAINEMVFFDATTTRFDTVHVAFIQSEQKVKSDVKVKLNNWLKTRIRCDSLMVHFE